VTHKIYETQIAMTDPYALSGRRALVTGASRGIGLAIAVGLADRGAAVVITGRKAEALETAAALLRSKGAQVFPEVCHQGEPESINSLFARLDQKGFQADIAVINAATNPTYGPLLETELAAWQKILDVNLTGAWLTAREAAQRMVAMGKGTLIFMASLSGLDPFPGLGAYSVSKAGLIGLTKALAKELAPAGVRVNAIAPGLIETRFSAALFENQEAYQRVMAMTPLGRHGQPGDVVGAATFLASEASAYMTGQVLVVDGGAHM
jgi:NAD(P)-dependent dehydrogenase (short-subunit alcohol dehydrogenase family)